jgi:hypothetical protein
MSRWHVPILALLLVAAGLGIAWHKWSVLGYPLQPSSTVEIWLVEARLNFEASDAAAKATLLIPRRPPGFIVLDENFVSRGYGLVTEDLDLNRQAVWTTRRPTGPQALYYRTMVLHSGEDPPREGVAALAVAPQYEEPYGEAIMGVLDEVRARSADIESFAVTLVRELNQLEPSDNVRTLLQRGAGAEDKARLAVQMLAGARIPARLSYAVPLVDGARDLQPRAWLEVNDGSRWLVLDPQTGVVGYPSNMLVWWRGDVAPYELTRGRNPSLQFAALKSIEPALQAAALRAGVTSSGFTAISLVDLPLHVQNLYRILLLVPLGALLIVLLRNVIGVQTFGTFMPVLIALSFRETQLVSGLVLFTVIVALGLLVRFYLERLKLLLVPRIAAVVITVIMLMAVVSIVSHRLHLEIGLSVALFPMVILAMTIERMSIVWEEFGPGDAIKQGFGSLLVAAVCYLLIFHPQVEHMMFVFPELLLAVLGITLLLGRYTGYRLTELLRFRDLGR